MPFDPNIITFPGNMGNGPPNTWHTYPSAVDITNSAPGSPRWWLAKGLGAITSKQAWFCKKAEYAFGPQPIPSGDWRFVRALKELQDKTETNYVQLVHNATVQRMRVKGFRFGEPQADEDAKRAWMANSMDAQMEDLLLEASVYGEGYLLVSPPDESGQPVITTESPLKAHVFPDPVNPTKSLCGVRVWSDIYEDRVIAVVYLPDSTHVFFGPTNQAEMGDIAVVDNYESVLVAPNPIGEVALVRIPWRPGGKGEADDVFHVQDRINHTILDRLLISKHQAYPQRWGTGVGLNRGKKRKTSASPFNPGTDTLWLVPDPAAKLGQFEQADIRQLLEAIREDVVDVSTMTQTPAHYLMGKMANVGGDTLIQAESGFVAKVKTRQRTVGWGIERAMKLVFLFLGMKDKAREIDSEVIWADPEVRSRAELADAAVKESQVFSTCPPFAIALVAERLGYEPDQIQTLVEGAEEWQKEQQQIEKDLIDQTNEGAIAVAKAGGKARPASGSTSKSSTSTTK